MLVKSQNFSGSLGQCLKRAKNSLLAIMNQKSKLAFVALLLIPLSAMAVDVQVTNYDDTPDPVPATQTVTYNMVVENSAADTALNVVANATVPAGMAFISATPSVGSCTFSAPNVQCSLGNLLGTLGGGSPVTIAIVMRATVGGGNSVSSTASATTTSVDTNPSNNSLPPQTTTIISGADLALSVTDSPDPVNGSGVITYTLLSENLGPDGVVNARIENTLPPGVSYISATGTGWNCSVAGQLVTCNRADTQPVGVLPQLVIQGRVNVGSGNITNVATISSPATPDGLPANNTVTTNTAVNPGADLAIAKGVSPNPVIANQTATFTLTTTNNGPSVANNVQVADSLPSGFTILTATGAGYTCVISGQDVTCDRATLVSGASSTITITATAPAVVPPAGLSTSNTANITTSTFDGNNANNTSTVNFTVNPAQADLSITKTKTPNPVAQGSNMSSTIVVHNNGPLNATSPVSMTDSLSTGETFVSASGTNWTCAHSGANPGGVVTCTYVNLPVGVNSSPLTIVTTSTNAGNLENQACTGGSAIGGNTHPEGDVNTANDCANATSNSTGQIADLAIVKSIPDAGDNPLTPTDNSLTYRLTISNSGPNTSTNVVVTDAIPMYTSLQGGSGFAFVANAGSAGAVGSCSNSGASVTCNYNQLQNGETAVIDITVSRPLLDGAFTNTANITSTSIGDPNPANNTSSLASTVQPVADVEMTGKSVTPSTVQAGVNSTYVLTFRNNGPSVAENVTVTDVFNPAVGDTGFTVISVTSTKGACAGLVPGTSYSGGTPTLTCNIGNMSPAEGQTVTLVIRPNYMAAPPAPRTLTNVASVITTTRESDGPPSTVNTNNSKNGLLTITPASLDLLINKTDNSPYGPDPIGFDPVTPANNVFAYRIRVTNLGPSYATGVVFTDTITTPGGKSLSFLGDTAVLGTPAAGICSGTASPFSGSGVYSCTVPAGIDAGATFERVLYFRAESSPAGGGDTFSDSVVVTSNEADTNAGNNSAVESTTVRVRTDLAVTSKTATPNPVNLREPFNWTIVVTNNGPGDASNPRLTDNLPANMELTGTPSFTKTLPAGGPTNCTGTAGATSFTCDLGAFNNTATATITVPVRITSYAASYTNSASISTQLLEVDPIAGNNSNTGNVAMVKSSIAGTVYRDFNDDGVIDGGETGIAGVQMRLTGTDLYGNVLTPILVTTNASGQYLFDNLPPSNATGYTVIEVAQPATFTDGKETVGTSGGTKGADNTSDIINAIVLASNTAATGYNFGEIPPVSVTGNVFNDTNGLNDTFVNGSGTNAGSGTLTAYLVRAGFVVSSSPVAAGGTFSLPAAANTTGYTVVLSNTAGVVNGAASPIPSLPAGWVNTGENNAAPAVAGSDGTINGISAPFDVALVTVPNRNFGIEQPPTSGTAIYAGQPNPLGTTTVPVGAGAFTGTLPPGVSGTNATDTAAVTNIRITAFPTNATSITINGITYTSATFPGGGVTVTVAQLAGMAVDPIDGPVTVDIPYVAIDAAGMESAVGHVQLPFGQITLSGNVFNDVNGSKVKDAAEAPLQLGLNAVLTDAAGTVVDVTPILADGTYLFNVAPNATYGVTVTTANPAIGATSVPVTLPAGGWVTTGESLAAVAEATPDSRQTVNVLLAAVTEVNFGLSQATAAVSGNVWRDIDHNRAFGAGETAVQGITVELLNAAGTVIVKPAVTTNASGHYIFNNLAPGDYTVRFRDNATGGIILGSPTYDDQVPGTSPADPGTATAIGSSRIDAIGQTLKVSLIANQELVKQSLPFDPSGVVYNSVTRDPVPGATVTLFNGGVAVPPSCLIGNQNAQVTGPLGTYQYLLIRPVPVGCPGSGAYTIQVQQPSGYLPPNAVQGGVSLPGGTYTPPAGVGVEPIQPQSTPPAIAVTGVATIYYFDFNFDLVGGRGVVNNHIPLDPVLSNSFLVTKTGNKSIAEIGDVVTYTVKAKMTQGLALTTFDLVDNLPAGFKYIPGTATQSTGGAAQVPLADPLPAGNLGPQLTFKPTFATQVTDATITYKVRVGVGAMQGDGINRVQGRSPFATSNIAQFKVKVTGGVFTNDACVAGKVFVDCNNNHIQDAEELGIPGVRMYMEDGTYFITDVEGKYSYCGISPKTHVLKVDSLTMPRGSRLTTTSNRNAGDGNSLFLDTKNGELIRADFAEGSCSNTVLEQVKARRTGGEVRAPETEKKGGPAIKFEGKSPRYPQQGTDSANQKLVKPRGGAGEAPVSNMVNDTPVPVLPDSSGNTRGNNLRDQKGEGK